MELTRRSFLSALGAGLVLAGLRLGLTRDAEPVRLEDYAIYDPDRDGPLAHIRLFEREPGRYAFEDAATGAVYLGTKWDPAFERPLVAAHQLAAIAEHPPMTCSVDVDLQGTWSFKV